MTSQVARPETIDRLANSVYPAFAMLAGMQLGLFTPLGDGPMTAEQIASALSVDPGKLRPLLYALVAAGLLSVEGDIFSNTPESDHFLVQERPTYIGRRHEAFSGRWNATLKTAETIRSGSPQAMVDYSEMSADQLESFARRRHTDTLAAGKDLLARFDFSHYHSLVDVGGGTGGLAIAATQGCPELQATVVDQPSVIPVAQRLVQEAGVADRVEVVAVDVVNGTLDGSFDVAVLRAFIQVLSADQARRVLQNVSRVVEPGGSIFILGSMLDNSRLTPPEMVTYNLFFINAFEGGQVYTEQEHRDWLAEAGFGDIDRVILPDASSIITARKLG